MTESLRSHLCYFRGRARGKARRVDSITGSAETLEVCQLEDPFLSWLVLELGRALIVLTLVNLCSFSKKGCQGPQDEERGLKKGK